MFEPINKPVLNNHLEYIKGISFEISKANKIREPEDREDPIHIHDYYEIFLNLSSDASMFINGEYHPLSYGTTIVVRPKQVHVCQFHKRQLHEFFCLWIECKDENSTLFSFFENEDLNQIYEFDEDTKKKIIDLFFNLLDCKDKKGSQLEQTSYLLDILTLLKQNSVSVSNNIIVMPNKLKEILYYVQQNYLNISNVKEISEKYYIALSTLNRWFRKYLHTTPHEYLDMHKLQYAEKLLISGNNVTEASSLAGYSDCSHFIALFRKKYGMTPFKYKKKYIPKQ